MEKRKRVKERGERDWEKEKKHREKRVREWKASNEFSIEIAPTRWIETQSWQRAKIEALPTRFRTSQQRKISTEKLKLRLQKKSRSIRRMGICPGEGQHFSKTSSLNRTSVRSDWLTGIVMQISLQIEFDTCVGQACGIESSRNKK